MFLSGHGYEVLSAPDGPEALALLTKVPDINFFLIDYNMPKMDGLTLCEQIRAIPHFATTPIGVLTSSTDKTLMAKGKTLGVRFWLVKPIANSSLLRLLEGLQLGASPRDKKSTKLG